MVVSTNVDTEVTMSSYGLGTPKEQLSELSDSSEDTDTEPQVEEAESDEPEEVDASAEEDEQIEEEESETSDDNSKLAEERKKRESAEEQMRQWQSRHDRQEAQIGQMHKDFLELKGTLEANQQEAQTDSEIDDDEYIDGRMLKEILSKQRKQEAEPYVTNQPDQDNYLNGRPDIDSVVGYMNEKQLAQDYNFNTIPTDKVGYYYAVQNEMLKEQVATLEAEKKKAISKQKAQAAKKKKPVPPTGGQGRSGKGNSQSGTVSDFEKQYMGFFKQRGFDL